MKFKSIAVQVSRKIISTIAIGTLLLSSAVGIKQFNDALENLKQRAHQSMRMTTKALSSPIWNYSENTIVEYGDEFTRDPDILYMEITDPQIDWIYRSDESLSDTQTKTRFCDSNDNFCSEAIVTREGEEIGRVFVIFSIKRVQKEALETAVIILMLGGLCIMILSILVRIFLRRIVEEPLSNLGDGARKLADGELDHNFVIQENNEVGNLAKNFMAMRDAIQLKISDLIEINDLSQKLNQLYESHNIEELLVQFCGQKLGTEKVCYYRKGQDDGLVEGSQLSDRMVSKEFMRDKGAEYLRASLRTRQIKAHRLESGLGVYIPIVKEDQSWFGVIVAVVPKEYDLVPYLVSVLENLARTAAIRLENLHVNVLLEQQNRNLEAIVNQRTQELRRKKDDIQAMLENINMGILTITPGQLIHQEYSKQMEQILESDQIANGQLMDVLFSSSDLSNDIKARMDSALRVAIGEHEMNFHVNYEAFVSSMHYFSPSGREKILELEWNPIIDQDGTVERIILSVKDVTEVRKLEELAKNQSRQFAVITEIVTVGSERYSEFMYSMDRAIGEVREAIDLNGQRNPEVINSIFRTLHTLKGNSRALGFKQMAEAIHNAEKVYSMLRQDPKMKWDRSTLRHGLNELEDCIGIYRDIYDQKLQKLGQDSKIPQLMAMLDEIDQEIDSGRPAQSLFPFHNKFKRILDGQLGLDYLFESIQGGICETASELNKRTPIVEYTKIDIFMDRDQFDAVRSVFVHLIHNSIDHGIEAPEERLMKRKDPQGLIQVDLGLHDGQRLQIHYQDDGRGLDIQALRASLSKDGIDHRSFSDWDLAHSIFNSGLSTKPTVTEVSGRGVGLDAVKHLVESHGGTITIELGEATAGFRSIAFRFDFILREPYNKGKLHVINSV
ncbi:ATP-binding protein [Pseudobacteriovorax antillogorgiicola]|uniref:histidine kinase n=1 Tax=Pseudobacteriovorax antillogorgiicola TaxID=1513793 RepID=A0A1Y6BEY9_9BACT|nr:ATP-binding protein [Pseudobacteriovorax antillogorgiicola]TCS57517.1 HAMP domain-containing protein [Pseudobacteriovorax antillogorgiicola]SMF00129.1 Hpt domain-containing protein [Pseudobacteriovorax antillogorgiicola]